MENDSVKDFGPITRDIYNAVSEIINSAYEQSISIIDSNCSIPDGYVKIPSKMPKRRKLPSNTTEVSDKVKDALCAVLPAGLSALGLAFDAPAVAVIVMTGAGGIASSFIQKTGRSRDMDLSDLHLDNIDLEKLTQEKIDITIKINQNRKQKLLTDSNKKLQKVCSEISAYEEKNNKKHDIEIDKEFGEWVQQFLMYTEDNQDDRKLQNIRNVLIHCLSSMNIHVYDEVQLREDGKPDVPIQDYLYDKRENHEAEYKEVSRPAVYSDCALLARGEIL